MKAQASVRKHSFHFCVGGTQTFVNGFVLITFLDQDIPFQRKDVVSSISFLLDPCSDKSDRIVLMSKHISFQLGDS